jgi:glycosyltransferase involved in cell wall biosynthesis
VRVVHIFKDYYPPTTGGIEQHMHLLCGRLVTTMEVAVLVPSRSRSKVEERLDGVTVVRVPEFGRYASVPLCPSMPGELRKLGPDIVHLHFPNPMGDIAYLLSSGGVPLVISYHADVVRQRALLPLYLPLLHRTFGQAGRILASSAEYIASSPILGRYRKKCSVIPYGIDAGSFALRDGERAQVEELRRDHPEGLVLFVGVLRPYKGMEVLLRAMVEAPQGYLVVVGLDRDRGRAAGLATHLGLSSRVAFEGVVSDSRLRALLHACDLLVLPSLDRREAFGIVQLEAMACGKPVVSSDLPTGVRLVNHDGETGLLVPPGDPEALAAAITRLLSDSTLRARLGQRARERVIREFSVDRMVNQTTEVYSQLVPSLHD